MASTLDGGGYWLAAADGGVFNFGDAPFLGSAGGLHLSTPVVSIAPTRSGDGFWLGTADGSLYTFGDAGYGPVEAMGSRSPLVGLTPALPDTVEGVTADGHVQDSDFGPLQQPVVPAHPIVGIIPAG
jgi:hypothetical protein